MKKTKMTAGFTLVELIVVIAILGILAGVGTVGYSGYIKKANMAADEQLLGYVNQAFAAACLENGKDTRGMSGVALELDSDKKVDVDTLTPADYQDEFSKYLGNTADSAFKVFEGLYFDREAGVFAENILNQYEYGDGYIYLSAADVAAFKGSTYDALGIDALLTKINDVSNFAKGVDSDSFDKVLNDPDYQRSMLKYLGVDSTEVDGYTDTEVAQNFMAAVRSMANNQDEMNKIKANMAVLYAAQCTNDLTTTEINTLFSSTDLKASLISAVNTDSGSGISQAAMIYGMYTAFSNSEEYGNSTRQDATGDPLNLILSLKDDELTAFQTYVKSSEGQKDMEAYLASMNMINSSTTDSNAVKDLLTEGFNNDTLVGVIDSAINNS